MSLLEKDFEEVIFDSLRGSPLYVGFDDKNGSYTQGDYSRELHCDLKLLAGYIEQTQPVAWKKLQKQYSGHEAAAVAAEINKLRPKRGILKLLREGFSLAGVGKVELVTFKPATGFNPTHREKYEANRFAVVRQFHFNTAKPNDSIDLVILINGLPLLSMEVKNEFTGQTWQHSEQQYRKDRAASEPFLKACVVHFAVDNTTISMTTKLENGKTRFLPFNRDLKNPPIDGNFASAYLWEDVVVDGVVKPGVLGADSMLDLLQNYLHLEEQTNEATGKVTTTLIFPRYHQLDCVRELLAEARAHGPGDNYLIQHSAGSGKSNTIAWLAHQLANLFTEDNQLIFDSVIIITDRQVLDKQLQETVKQFEKTPGLVQKIDKNTQQLVDALAGGAKIIVCTLQKFSWMRNVLGGPRALKGKKFALIVDEAHSSQSGEGAKDLKLVLTTPEALKAIIAEDEENREWTDPVAEELAQIMKGRQRLPHLSFFAFTATPKTKTLEVFGKAREVVTADGVKKVEHKAFTATPCGRPSRRVSSSTCSRAMDKFRLQEKENGSIMLNPGDTEMENTSGDGHGPGGNPEKEKLEVIVKELNERFHFDFEDRDKVLSIVIPKLAKDAGLIAAFQTNNLETLRKQKFADSLESAFISSAGEFYSVLNRMSAEPDFKRVLTEFALGEFKRGLAAPEVIPFRPRIVQPGTKERYVTCVPLVPLKAAAGAFSVPQHIDDEGFEWAAVETKRHLRPGMFVAQVVGKSMEPAIPDGAYCLFAAPVEGTRQGKTVLVQLRDAADPESGERYTVKRYESEKAQAGDSWRHERITLKPVNPDFKPIVLTGADEGQLQVIAELVEVLESEAKD